MKIVVLSTETLHHAYFVRELGERFPVDHVLLETRTLKAPFEIRHPFEDDRDAYELEVCFGGTMPVTADYAEAIVFPSVNDEDAVAHLVDSGPDVIIVVGTGIIRAPLIEAFQGGLINLHGGDPEEYRGLDSHLWSIYHSEFDSLKVTLHHVNGVLDDGEIIGQKAIPLHKGMPIHQLRRANVDTCLDLTYEALATFAATGAFSSRRQTKIGRYYSFMPAVMKDLCCTRFAKHTASL